MKKTLTALLATGFIAGFAGAGLACPIHSAELHQKMTVAQAETPVLEEETGMSTYDPELLKKLEQEPKAE